MKEKTYTAIDQPNGMISVTTDGLDEILLLSPIQALELASSLKNAVNNNAIDLMRLIKES